MQKIDYIYNRGYQKALKLGMSFLDWSEPELIEGAGSVKRLAKTVKQKGFDNVLVVTDSTLAALHLPDGMLEVLKENGIKYTVFDKTQPNPTIDNIEDARQLFLDDGCQAIIAFGGGSSMDCAKGAAARIARPHKSIPQMRGTLKVLKSVCTIFAVPTTAGTGSEVTVAAVVSDPKTHEKYPVNDPKLRPDVAVLDPELTVGLPKRITAITGMDALTHAVEAYIGKSNVPSTIRYAESAVGLIFGNLEKAFNDGANLEARGNMLKAAYYAGLAFTRAYVGYVHAIGHNLGGMYGIPHGHAMSILLPEVLDFYGEAAYAPLARLSAIAGVKTDGTDADKAKAFIKKIREMNAAMEIPDTFSQIREEDIPTIVKRAFREAHPDYPVPKFMTEADCAAVIRKVAGIK